MSSIWLKIQSFLITFTGEIILKESPSHEAEARKQAKTLNCKVSNINKSQRAMMDLPVNVFVMCKLLMVLPREPLLSSLKLHEITS